MKNKKKLYLGTAAFFIIFFVLQIIFENSLNSIVDILLISVVGAAGWFLLMLLWMKYTLKSSHGKSHKSGH